jgi:hypothetical protein
MGSFIYLFLRKPLLGVADKMQESSINHTTRLYCLQEAICIYRCDFDNMLGSCREYLNLVEEGAEFMFSPTQFHYRHRLACASACTKPKLSTLDQKSSATSSQRSVDRSNLREGMLYVRVRQPALHYKLGQISKAEKSYENSNSASAAKRSATSASASADEVP